MFHNYIDSFVVVFWLVFRNETSFVAFLYLCTRWKFIFWAYGYWLLIDDWVDAGQKKSGDIFFCALKKEQRHIVWLWWLCVLWHDGVLTLVAPSAPKRWREQLKQVDNSAFYAGLLTHKNKGFDTRPNNNAPLVTVHIWMEQECALAK